MLTSTYVLHGLLPQTPFVLQYYSIYWLEVALRMIIYIVTINSVSPNFPQPPGLISRRGMRFCCCQIEVCDRTILHTAHSPPTSTNPQKKARAT